MHYGRRESSEFARHRFADWPDVAAAFAALERGKTSIFSTGFWRF